MPKRNGKRAKVTSKEISRLDDESLLKLRFCDLDLRIEDTVLQDRIDQLYEELEGPTAHPGARKLEGRGRKACSRNSRKHASD